MRAMMMAIALFLAAASSTSAKGPPGQGRSCDARNKCDSGLACVGHRDGRSTCELRCAANATCPEDQRCVRDEGEMVCRPINDGVGLATEMKTPAGQGRACDARSKCDGGMQCTVHAGGKSTCEIACTAATKCPEDQRCVKDGAQMLCRPITDL
jgi:hypothetical protein